MSEGKDTRFKPGHPGYKKPGDSAMQKEIRQKVGDILKGKLEKIDEIFEKASGKEQLRFLAELMPYIIAKKKEIEISGELSSGPRFKTDLTKLSPDELRIYLKAHEIVSPDEESNGED